MKKYLFLLVATFFANISIPAYAEDDKPKPKPSPEPIPMPIKPPIPNTGELNPRTLVPISGMYANGAVELIFAADLGAVYVTVINTSTGNMWYESADSCDGLVSIAIPAENGEYVVTI